MKPSYRYRLGLSYLLWGSISATPGLTAQVPAVPQPVLQSEILSQRIGTSAGSNYTGSSLVQVCVGVEPPVPVNQLPGYALDGVRADAFPISRNAAGLVSAVHLAALVPNPSGTHSIPGVPATDPVQLEYTSAPSGPPAIIPLFDIRDVELLVRPSGTGNMTCRPFDGTFPGYLGSRVSYSGKYTYQLVTSSQFILPTGGQTPTESQNALVVYGILTLRSDFPAATLDIVVTNGAYDSSFNVLTNPTDLTGSDGGHPNGQNRGSDGPFFFKDMTIDLSNTSLSAVALAERGSSFAVSPNGKLVTLVGQPNEPGWSGEQVNSLYPGAIFARRLCVYKAEAMANLGLPAAQIASDIVKRRDFGWAAGSIGYMNGGYSESQFKTIDMGFYDYSLSGTNYSGWLASQVRGQVYETSQYAALAASITGISTFAGWFKPAGGDGSQPQGEDDIMLGGYTWPSNGEMVARLILGDRYMERAWFGMVDVALGENRGFPLQDDELVRQGGGVLPTGYSGLDHGNALLIPQHYTPLHNPSIPSYWNTPIQATNAEKLESARLDLSWNRPAAGQVCPYNSLYNWAHGQGPYYGPLHYSHVTRPMSQWRASAYGLNDTVSWMAMEFQAKIYALAAARFDVPAGSTNGLSGNRFRFGRGQSNLWAFKNVFLGQPANAGNSKRGFWSVVPDQWTSPQVHAYDTPRNLIAGWAAFACHYAHANDAERARWHLNEHGLTEGGEHDIRNLIGAFYGYVITDIGMIVSSDKNAGSPQAYSVSVYGPCVINQRTGAIPGFPHNIPEEFGVRTTDRWGHCRIYQQAYGHAALQGLDRAVLDGTAYHNLFDAVPKFADQWADASDGFLSPAGFAYFCALSPTSRGTLGNMNMMPTDTSTRGGEIFWRGRTQDASPEDRYPYHYALLASWARRNAGTWGSLVKGLERNFEVSPGSGLPALRLALEARFEQESNSGAHHLADHIIPIIGLLQ